MPEFDERSIERVISTSQKNCGAIAQSLNLCFDRQYRVEIGDSFSWDAAAVPGELAGPGLLVAFEVGGQGLLCFIPETLPLPQWYTQPGESEESRLQTLAMEWPLNMLPDDLEASQFKSQAVDDFKAAAIAANPAERAGMVELFVFDEPTADDKRTADGPDKAETEPVSQAATDAQPIARITLLCPVTNPPFEAAESGTERQATSLADQSTPAESPVSAVSAPAADMRSSLLSGLPVTVTVRLAEKKIELGPLLSLTPGALITFNKSCEDLLDLFVNNHLYCRGEAVKIGEKFGLKINEVGVEEVREERVLNI